MTQPLVMGPFCSPPGASKRIEHRGDAPDTCRFCIPGTSAPPRSAPRQPHAAGAQITVSPG
jgi:hypothetical protein